MEEFDISKIITECLNNPIIQYKITITQGLNYAQKKQVNKELARILGYCILFKSNENIEEYMLLTKKEEQIQFLQKKIARNLGIELKDIPLKRNEIINYIYENFRKNGYVFHAANSKSIEQKMKNRIKW